MNETSRTWHVITGNNRAVAFVHVLLGHWVEDCSLRASAEQLCADGNVAGPVLGDEISHLTTLSSLAFDRLLKEHAVQLLTPNSQEKVMTKVRGGQDVEVEGKGVIQVEDFTGNEPGDDQILIQLTIVRSGPRESIDTFDEKDRHADDEKRHQISQKNNAQPCVATGSFAATDA